MSADERSRVGRSASVVAIWCALFGLWMLVVGSVSRQELVVGAVAAALATVAGLWAARVTGVQAALPRWWRRALAVLPGRVAGDVLLLVQALVGSCRGRPPASDTVRVVVGDARPARRRSSVMALAVLVLSTPPNTIVVDEDGDEGLVVHRLVPTGEPDRLVTRR